MFDEAGNANLIRQFWGVLAALVAPRQESEARWEAHERSMAEWGTEHQKRMAERKRGIPE